MAADARPRIPKLAVRNRVPEDEIGTDSWIETIDPALRTSDGSNDDEAGPSSPRPRPSSATVDEPGLRELLASQRYSTGQTPNTGGLNTRAKESPKQKTKKYGGVKALLTLKEPSTKAWEEFAEREKAKEKAKTKGVHMAAFGSSQKMPDYVPKVNSKWDGMPERKASDKPKKSGSSKSRPKLSNSTGTAEPRVDSATSVPADKPSFDTADKPSFESVARPSSAGSETPEIPIRSPARINSNTQTTTLQTLPSIGATSNSQLAPAPLPSENAFTSDQASDTTRYADVSHTADSEEIPAARKMLEEREEPSPTIEPQVPTTWLTVASQEVPGTSPSAGLPAATTWLTVATNTSVNSGEATTSEAPQSPRARNFSRPFSPTDSNPG